LHRLPGPVCCAACNPRSPEKNAVEVKLDKRYPVAASVTQCWAVLSDVRATAACMPGAAITEQVDATHYKGTVKSKIGPAVMQFGGDVTVLALEAERHALQLLAKGADKSGSSAQMNLSAHLEAGDDEASAVLVGAAVVTVSGKLAQFGSRLLVPVSDAMLAQFADNFRAAAAAVPVPAPVATASAAAATSVAPAALVVPAPTRAALVPQPARELNVLALAWAVIKGWFAGFLGKRR
jgi:carbon monoxide dehydrogenase subunit G